jgi:hypothetical protein
MTMTPTLPRGLSVAGGVLPPVSKMGLPIAGGATSLTAPTPMPTPAFALPQVPAAPPKAAPAAPQIPKAPAVPMVQLASGKMITPGIYNQGDHAVSITDDGSGHAKIARVTGPMAVPGVIDPLREANADTIAGGMIRKMIPKVAADAVSNFNAPAALDNVKSSAVNAASNLGSSLGGFGSGIGSAFSGLGGLFGAPKPPTSAGPTAAQLQAIRNVPPNAYYPMAPVPLPRPPNFYLQQTQPPSLPTQIGNGLMNIFNHSAPGHVAQFLTGKPVTGGFLSLLQGNPIQAARLVSNGVLSSPPPVPSQPVGASYLQAQGQNTAGMTDGQVADALKKSMGMY